MDCETRPCPTELSEPVFHSLHPCTEPPNCAGSCYRGPSMACFWEDSKPHSSQTSLVVIGHRGCGKNFLQHSEISSRPSIMENTITSFNAAAVHGANFVEFDVQLTKDGCPVLFHDESIVALVQGERVTKKVSEMSLAEFLSFGYQKHSHKTDKHLHRKVVDGSFPAWTVSIEDSFCTLEEAFNFVSPSVGFNIELKYDESVEPDTIILNRTIDATLQVVDRCAGNRKLFFSSFHPDAAQIVRRKQDIYPVFFITDGGVKVNADSRKNSIEAAIEVCREGGLQGIVCQVKALLQNAWAVKQMHSAGLSVLTYGELNNFGEALRKQENAGVEGVIVDHVAEMVAEVHNGNRFAGLSDHSTVISPTVPELKPMTSNLPSPLLLKAVRA